MKKIVLVFSFLLVFICAVKAQSATAQWTQTEAPSIASQYVYTLKNSAVSTTAIITATCVASGSNSSCTAPVPSNLIVPGTFTLTVTCGTAQGCTGSSTSDPFVVGSPAKSGNLVIKFP